MKHYNFAPRFHAIYDKAVALYVEGRRDPATYFVADELAWLAANGITAQHIYDYAEDHNKYGGPGYDTALSIELVRRDYFINVQHGQPSSAVIDESKLPGKAETVGGIVWLPRLLPKARAKLRGELPASLMYCCGGDRNFFETHDIQPGEFLHLVWHHLDDDQPIIDWVSRRSAAPRV